MRKVMYLLILSGIVSWVVHVASTHPTGWAKLKADLQHNSHAMYLGAESVTDNGQNHGDRLQAAKKFGYDLRQDFVALEGPDESPQAPGTPPPKIWEPPDHFPAKVNWTWLTTSGVFYRDVKITDMQADAVAIAFDGGTARIAVADLSITLQKEVGYDSLSAPGLVTATTTEWLEGWETDDYAQGLAKAKLQGKKLLLLFTGSTWCPTCMGLEKYVLPYSRFQDFVIPKYIMVKIERQHEEGPPTDPGEILAEKYKETGLPTLVATDSEGKELGRSMGCPTEFVRERSLYSFTGVLLAELQGLPPPADTTPF